ncbi:sigma-70 family RNA polymerase sigma factor [Azospirillum oleiclasticum]|uniref:RNA polymerase sigma factor n=1 Tax=Azospirillum oleiclasticum TaxID=2735135 RepID=UPI0031B5ADCC
MQSIYLDHRALLLGQAQRIVRDRETAEDLIQESYLRAHHAAEKGPIENVAGFLCRTVRNLALDHLRRRQAKARVEIGSSEMVDVSHVPCGTPSAEDRMLQRERLDRFRGALDSLPERARRVWMLNRLEGWSYPAIAEHLGVSPGTVFNDMKLAMGHMADALSRAERER